MNALRPRELLHRGRVSASGFWFDRELLGEREARQRILALARRVVSVRDVAGGYFVELDEPWFGRAEEAIATPLVHVGGRWHGLPMHPNELARAHLPAGSLVLMRGGRVLVESLANAPLVRLAQWLDFGGWSVLQLASLGAEPGATRPTLLGEPEPTDARTILGAAVPTPDARQQEILDELRRRSRASTGAIGEVGPDGGGMVGTLRAWVRRMAAPADSPALPGTVSRSAMSTGTSGTRELGRVRRWLRQLVATSMLGRVIGRKQADYLHKTLKMFEDGEWDAALRHAIPFSSLPGAPLPPALSVPTARRELRLQATPGPAPSTSLDMGPDLYAHFGDLYRRAARALEEEGRLEEAAFVWFELLHEPNEGVAMLERHGRTVLAAQMAQGRDMPAGLVIRLWFLAGEPAKAVLVARRTGAFGDAVARLERSGHHDEASRLRLLWGDRLAEAGEMAAAVSAVWPVQHARSLARAWIDRAIAFGGPAGTRMLPKKLALCGDDPEARADVRDRVLALLGDETPEGSWLRSALATAWADLGPSPPPLGRELGRALARRILLDPHAVHARIPRELLRVCEDPVFELDTRIDAPKLQDPAPSARSRRFESSERGLMVVHDAVTLPNGRLLLALGDAGLRITDRSGRTLTSYEHPASKIVLADSGMRAITLMPRGRGTSSRRIDLVTGRAEPWCDAHFEHAAASYDGATWFLSVDDAVVAVDAQARGFDALWRVSELGAPVVALARSASRLSFVLLRDLELETWMYELSGGGPVLRQRSSLALPPGSVREVVLHPEGWIAASVRSAADRQSVTARTQSATTTSPGAPGMRLVGIDEQHLVWLQPGDECTELHCRTDPSPGVTVGADDNPRLVLDAATMVSVHVIGDRLVVADDLGRVVELTRACTLSRWWVPSGC